MNDLNMAEGILLFILLCVIGCILVVTSRQHRASSKLQIKLFLTAIAIRFVVSIIIYQFGVMRALGDEDSSGWVGGLGLYQTWTKNAIGLIELPAVLLNSFQGHHQGYYYFVGGLFYTTGLPGRMSAAAMNCFLGAITVVLVYRIASVLFSDWVAVRVGWMSCLFPSLIIWSAQTVKEPIVILIETIALYGCVQLKVSGFSLKYILICAAACIVVIPFRFYAAYIIGLAVLLSLMLPQVGKMKSTLTSWLAVGAIVGMLFVSSGFLANAERQTEGLDLKYAQTLKKNLARGTGSGVENDYDLQTPGGFGMATLIGFVHVMLAPFPWQLAGGSTRLLFTAPEMVYWWWLFFVGLIPGIRFAFRTKLNGILPLLVFIGGLSLLYSVTFGNVGLAYRQRSQLLPWLLIFACVGLEQRMLKKRNNRIAQSQRTSNGLPAIGPSMARRT